MGHSKKSWHREVIFVLSTQTSTQVYVWNENTSCTLTMPVSVWFRSLSWDLSPFSVFGFLQLIFLGGAGSGNDSPLSPSSFSCFVSVLALFHDYDWHSINFIFCISVSDDILQWQRYYLLLQSIFLFSFIDIGLVSQWYSKR